MVCKQCQGSTRGGFGVASQKLHQEPEVQELQQEPQAQGLTGARGGSFTLPPHSALTSSCGRRLMRIRSAFSLSCLLSMRAKRSLEALSWQGEARAERSYTLPVPRTLQWAEPPCTMGCHKSKPCTQEMNQPHAAPASDPPCPSAHGRASKPGAHAVLHTRGHHPSPRPCLPSAAGPGPSGTCRGG